ncbi:MAG: hypothetical protein KA408_05410 [Flavobacteriales bacterium]|nr:hypothetical protein [Flavobacteriales bacterium]
METKRVDSVMDVVHLVELPIVYVQLRNGNGQPLDRVIEEVGSRVMHEAVN